MSKYTNTIVSIKNNKMLTFNKTGVVSGWDSKIRKYIVEFDESWIGWYSKKDLNFIKNDI